MGYQPSSLFRRRAASNRAVNARQGHGPAIQPLRVHEGHGDGCEPVAKERSSAPEHDGHSTSRYSSISCGAISDWASEMLPQMSMSLPGCSFSLATSSTALPLTILASSQAPQLARSRVFEKTTFGVAFNLSANGFLRPP